MESQRLQELEELSRELQKLLASDWAEGRLRRSLARRSQADSSLLQLQAEATRIEQELSKEEEELAKVLLRKESDLQSVLQAGQEGEKELEEAQRALGDLKVANKALEQELQELQQLSLQLDEELKQEEAVPPEAHLVQLYYHLSHIEWDYEADPSHVRGIHYGPAVAQPFSIGSSLHSPSSISDFLWSLVPSSW